MSITFPDAAEEVRERFLANVRLHLRSDVPFGIALSGGIDSSSIASAVRYLEPEIDLSTFSFVSPGSVFNEEPWIDLMNLRIGASQYKVTASASELANDLDSMIRAQGEPFGSTSIYAQYRVYQKAKEAGIKVMLDGQGADELFGGYVGYARDRIRSLILNGDIYGWSRFVAGWSKLPGRSLSNSLKHSLLGILPSELLLNARGIAGSWRLPPWIIRANVPEFETSTLSEFGDQESLRGRWLAYRLRNALTLGEMGILLRNGDRNSMHWSIESRVPFLTTDLAEFALRLPEKYLISPSGDTKWVLREAMRGIVPDQILDRKDKIGFETPEEEWLLQLRPNIGEWLDGLDEIPFIDAGKARTHVNEALSGDAPFTWRVWRLINASRWSQVF